MYVSSPRHGPVSCSQPGLRYKSDQCCKRNEERKTNKQKKLYMEDSQTSKRLSHFTQTHMEKKT